MTFLPRTTRARAIAALLVAAPVATAAAQAAPPTAAPACPASAGRTALVLPGGGVRGMAHIGVIQVLDSLGIVPDFVVGTSMGAIVGALYASGYTGDEIEAVTRRYDLGDYVGRYAPRAPRALGPQPPLLLWEEGVGGVLDIETSAAQEGPVNALLAALMLRGNLLARGDFDRLPIPFRAVATDLRTGGRVSIGTGDLAEAVRASFAIPLVFDAVHLDGRVLVDGGIVENVPVKLAREMGATRVVLSWLTLPTLPEAPTAPDIAQRMVDLLFEQAYPPLGEGDALVTSKVDDVANLDFSDRTVRAMIARGRDAARMALAGCPGAGGTRARPEPPPLAARLVAGNANARARHFAQKTLGARADEPMPFDTLQARLARLAGVDAVRGAWLHPQAAAGDSVALRPDVQLAPRRAVGAGLAYDGDLGGRVWAGGVDRRLAGRPLEAALRGAAGEYRQDVTLELRKGIEDVRDARTPFATATAALTDIPLFTDRGVERSRSDLPRVDERLAMGGVDLPLWLGIELRAAGLVRHWRAARDTVMAPADDVREHGSTAGISLRLSKGAPDARGAFVAEGEWTPLYSRATLSARQGAVARRTRIEASVRLAGVTRSAPLTTWLPLGGSEGFAGLRVSERLGRAEAFGSLDVSRPLFGPVRVHVTGMGGTVSATLEHPMGGEWLAGVRGGIGAETPIGPVRAQFGVNGDRRSQWYLRVGRWF